VRGALSLTPKDDLSTWLPKAIAERARHTGPMFRINAVKFFADGVIEGHTGYLDKPYKDALAYAGDKTYRGTPIWTPAEMAAAFTAIDKAGFQIHVHAIGDAATTEVLDALALARKANGAHDWRPGITHLQLVDPADYKRFASLGVTAVPDPYWFLMDDYYWNLQLPYLGKYRADHEYPMKSFFTAGALVASASDFPVTIPPDPIIGIQTGVMRWAAGWGIPMKNVLWRAEKVGVRQMIRSFTINGAKADFTDRVTGSLKRGKSADLIVLSKNLLTLPNVQMDTAHVALTVFQGKVVYRK
jgi:predicted amidohydrolase YtcJ